MADESGGRSAAHFVEATVVRRVRQGMQGAACCQLFGQLQVVGLVRLRDSSLGQCTTGLVLDRPEAERKDPPGRRVHFDFMPLGV